MLRTGKSLNLNLFELNVWLGINFVMSSLKFPKIRMYWERKWGVPLIADAMSWDRYFTLRSSLKVVSYNEISREERVSDRIWKVRPLVIELSKDVRNNHATKTCHLMIPFSGACPIKQYVPNKPNPVGLKVLSNPSGIVCNLFVYEGK